MEFMYKGTLYSLPNGHDNAGYIRVDGMVLEIHGWRESDPPQPSVNRTLMPVEAAGLTVVNATRI